MANVEIQGLKEQIKRVREIMTDSPGMEKRLREALGKALAKVRKRLMDDARTGLGMQSDPRNAYKAVLYTIYSRLLGGNVSILQRRKAGRPGAYVAPRSGHIGRGGNRWGRSARTEAMQGYEGTDRGFALRFLNSGTVPRKIHSYTDRGGVKNDTTRGGNRGAIASRNWFGTKSKAELEKIVPEIDTLINEIINGTFV